MKTFHPKNNNLGGQRIISTHQSKHILSVLNATPLVNSLKVPHPHVNGTRNKKKDIELNDYFHEVNETYRRVNSLKHGYVNHSAPKTFHLRNSISKRLVFEKNIILHDHMRNINHLSDSIRAIGAKSEKKIETIKSMGLNGETSNNGNLSKLSSKKSIRPKVKSIDFLHAAELIGNYNPFQKNTSCYDAADSSLNIGDKVICAVEENPEDRKRRAKNPGRADFERELEDLNLKENDVNLKKKIIGFMVRNRVYEREGVEELRGKIMERFRFLDEEAVEGVFIEILDHFFK